MVQVKSGNLWRASGSVWNTKRTPSDPRFTTCRIPVEVIDIDSSAVPCKPGQFLRGLPATPPRRPATSLLEV